MAFLRLTKGLAVALTVANAIVWAWQGHWLVGICIGFAAFLAARYLPEE
jgi:hypothetical protein